MNVTPWPMKTWSSIVTPSQMNVWLEILQRLPTVAFFWISTNAPIFVSSPIVAAVQVDERRELDVLPELHVGGDGAILIHGVHGRRQAAPLPEITAAGVASRIFTSVQSERVLA